jgi:RNA-directed DNA polymerase
LPLVPKAGAQCGKSARWDLRGGPPARAVPTATGAFYKSALYCLLTRINAYLLRWVRSKYRRLRGRMKAHKAWIGVTQRHPRFFAHWAWINMPPTAG